MDAGSENKIVSTGNSGLLSSSGPLISVIRSATSLSTMNCFSSEVTRRTMIEVECSELRRSDVIGLQERALGSSSCHPTAAPDSHYEHMGSEKSSETSEGHFGS